MITFRSASESDIDQIYQIQCDSLPKINYKKSKETIANIIKNGLSFVCIKKELIYTCCDNKYEEYVISYCLLHYIKTPSRIPKLNDSICNEYTPYIFLHDFTVTKEFAKRNLANIFWKLIYRNIENMCVKTITGVSLISAINFWDNNGFIISDIFHNSIDIQNGDGAAIIYKELDI